MKKEIYNKYLGLGFQLLELGENKTPLKKRYCKKTGKPIRASEPFSENIWYGISPSKNIMVIDVDVKNGKIGRESLSKLEDDLMIDLIPSVKTGSGGLHYYVTVDKPIRITQKDYPDVDFICHKANVKLCTPFAVAGGQTIIDGGKDYVYTFINDDEPIYVNDIADDIGDILEVDVITAKADDSIISVDDLHDKKTPDEITAMLEYIDASDYQEWMANASAIKRELGNTEQAFNIFHEWSKTADNYENRASCIKKWKEVGEYQGTPRTMATLYMNAVVNKTNQLLTLVNDADDVDEIEDILNETRWVSYPKLPPKVISNEVCKSLQNKITVLGTAISYNGTQKIAKVLHGKDNVTADDVADIEVEGFEDFVRVASFTRCPYFQISTGAKHDLEGVNMMLHDSLVTVSQKLGLKKTMTIQQAFQKKLISYAVSHEYNPTTNEVLFTNSKGQKILNLFDAKSVPQATETTKEGKRLINKFINHLAYLMSADEANILLDWMAYACQNLGKKILWTPLIQSVEGVGKSLIGNLLINHVFGKANAGVVDSVIIADANNSWASSKVLRVLEEIKLSGHNRYEVLNQLKPLITNPTITRREKFEVSSEVRNTCNFIAFTNYKDALPIDEHDRRWWVVFSPIHSLKDLERITGQAKAEYFEPLHRLARANSVYGSEFKTFLLERDVSNFNPNFPPESDHKAELAEIETAKINGVDEMHDLITATYKVEQPPVINIKLLREASENALNDNSKRITPKTLTAKEIRTILPKMGYKSITKKQYPKADWKGITPMFYHSATTSIPEAIIEWEKGYAVDFVADMFDTVLDDEL